MKKIAVLSLLLLLATTTFTRRSAQATDSVEIFWQAFKTAVVKHDVEGVVHLSKFPIGMSYGIPSVKTKAQLIKRYRQVFNEQTDAAVCFGKAKPDVDAKDPKQFTVACPDAAGNKVVIYHFQQTRAGWRFTGLDNLNE
jgi:hypothetical protein